MIFDVLLTTILLIFCGYIISEELAAIAYVISISIPWPYFVYKSNKFIKH